MSVRATLPYGNPAIPAEESRMWNWLRGFFEERRRPLSDDERDYTVDRVSTACLRGIIQHEVTRGVDLPTWRTPAELAKMRRADRRAALHVVRRTGTGN